MRIRSINIRQIFATNSQKTIEIEIETLKGRVTASVPIGTSKGRYEANYLPIDQVVNKFNLIRRQFTSEDFTDQEDVDTFLRLIDKTDNFKEIGGNLALAISSVYLKAFAMEEGLDVFEYVSKISKQKFSIPRPICNIIGGWKYTQRSDIQEYHFLPVHQRTFFESISKINSAYLTVGKMLKEADPTFSYAKNVEDAWVTNLQIEEILKILTKVANDNLLKIGLDLAASHLWDEKQYYVYTYSNKIFRAMEQLRFIKELARKFPIIYIEDPFNEDDFTSFGILTHELPNRIVCGDDLYTTNLKRVKDGIDFKATNAVLVKPNQVGTITDVMKVVEFAKQKNLTTVMSHRSGETEDTLISHLAVGLGCNYVKFGISGERTTKINEIIRIEEKLTQ
jgi:enolase